MSHYKNGLFQQANHDSEDEVSKMMGQCKELAREIKRDRPNRRCLPAGLYRTFPRRQVIDELVQLYFTTTETCYPILHYPTFMMEYLACIDDLEGAKGSFLVELLLLMSVTGMMHNDAGVREELCSKTPTWLHISQTWLSAPMEKDRLTIKGIQVHCLLLLARQVNRVGADIVWISVGSLIRMAMQMGLHQDPDHLGDMSAGQKEIRRQLWYTILEMNVQAALDSGMAPMITHADYNTLPPSGKILDANSTIRQDNLEQTYLTAQPQLSFQHLLAESLPLRTQAVIVINSLQEEPEYKEILALGNALSTAFRKTAVAIEREVSWSQQPPSQFTQSFCSHLLRRFILCLHFMYAVKARENQLYTHSHQVCLDVALDLIALLDDHLYCRLLINGGGMFRDIITRGALMLYLELNSSFNSEISILAKSRHRAYQQVLIKDAHRVVKYAKERMSCGETNVKGYVFLSMATAQVEALFNGSSAEEAMSNAATESLKVCHQILTELAGHKEDHCMDPELESWIYHGTVTSPGAMGTDFGGFNDDPLSFDFLTSNLFQQWIDHS
ncbi:transcriptional regulator family: Fungal Specific TF [Penicillium longicatenatum]|uniref:transcriptional regulator family: Fungal Specific TF n=1 Tax=Penicillium longicatenatum TaxID=1561947 RepID=UPI002549B6FF|nr:transcriptional regulator family: Fungal Specific TF [Penicillium longicatenatum]KAJ5631925.1 transcriptional regulator family: Fungal Specific TF [Penicillium longicatenatum]